VIRFICLGVAGAKCSYFPSISDLCCDQAVAKLLVRLAPSVGVVVSCRIYSWSPSPTKHRGLVGGSPFISPIPLFLMGYVFAVVVPKSDLLCVLFRLHPFDKLLRISMA
jgi:hypothetical protein